LNHVCSIHWMFLYGIHCWCIGHFALFKIFTAKLSFISYLCYLLDYTWLLEIRHFAWCSCIFLPVLSFLLDPSLRGPRWNSSLHVFAGIYAHVFQSMWIAFFFYIVILYWFLDVCSNLRILWPVYILQMINIFCKIFLLLSKLFV
jgi:hypothetical protein